MYMQMFNLIFHSQQKQTKAYHNWYK